MTCCISPRLLLILPMITSSSLPTPVMGWLSMTPMLLLSLPPRQSLPAPVQVNAQHVLLILPSALPATLLTLVKFPTLVMEGLR